MEPSNPLLDQFVLGLARSSQPRVLFLPTASGDPTGQINAFYARFSGRACTAEHLSLFRLREARRPLRETVLAFMARAEGLSASASAAADTAAARR